MEEVKNEKIKLIFYRFLCQVLNFAFSWKNRFRVNQISSKKEE